MPFELRLNGAVYRTDSLTLDEMELLETECDKTWLELNPVRSAREFKATARVLLTRDHAPADVERIVASITVAHAMQSAQWIDDDLPDTFEDGAPAPKAEGGHSTPTSSTSPNPPTNGPPT